ncbi:TPA: beta-glucosidase [Candidatus Falkowbacteria bacterium]|nr:beta-glucosidase [Candidatus Falkowbacteria bacterium]
MNFKFHRSKLIIFLLVALLLTIAFVFIFIKRPFFPLVNKNNNCQQTNLPYQNSALPIDQRVADLMSRMTDVEKIGQMVLIEKNSIHNLDDISRYNIGALLSGGGAGPKQDTPLAWLQMINDFDSAAKETCLGIPLLYGIDAVHGHGNVLGATIFPHAIGLGAANDPDLVTQVAQATADEMAATGIYWNFAPNLDVAKDIRWGKTYETFGSNPANNATLGSAYLKGMQTNSNDYFNVLATAKHYIGGGNMEFGTSRNKDFKVEEGNITLDETSLRQTHLIPFQKAVTNGAKVVMVSTATWNNKMNTSNHYLLTDILKTELGFSGFIVSDWYGVYAVADSKYDSIVNSVNAGVDMVMTPFDYKDFIFNVQQALSKGDITKDRIDNAVTRILTVKFETGLFDRPQALPEGLAVIGSDQHRDIAREAVRKSQVLLKNNQSVLPLSKSVKKIIVAGSAADNLGRQAGGWTTEWQGIDGNEGIVGITILEAIKKTVSADTEVEYDKEGDYSLENNLADVGIVVVGEKPYAEGWGDNANPSLSPEDLSAIENVKAKSKKIVVIIVAGRPLDIKEYAQNWDAIVASWLPGSEGQGVADVLFGDYAFTGKLPVAWELR